MRKIIVCGAGASGLMAAIMAAREGASVTILEQNDKPGKKLLATGNGRCNFANQSVPADAWRSDSSEKLSPVFSFFSAEQSLAFFREIGVYPISLNGWMYPRSRSAASFLELLLMEASRLGVRIKSNTRVLRIEKRAEEWLVQVEGWQYSADAVILANGSRASSIKGSDGSGYFLAEQLRHTVIPPLPALCPLKTKEHYAWGGVRAQGTVTLLIDQKEAAVETGELQFTDYGISGIPIFQLSRYAVRALHHRQTVQLRLNLLPEYTQQDFSDVLNKTTKKKLLTGLFPEKLQKILEKEASPIEKAFCLPLTVTGFLDEQHAQVCQGGVSLKEIFVPSMESRHHSNLYFCGELLDVDGRCGGYNLQWAWSSGAAAGIHAARNVQKGESQ